MGSFIHNFTILLVYVKFVEAQKEATVVFKCLGNPLRETKHFTCLSRDRRALVSEWS